jgi:hypothetical protein
MKRATLSTMIGILAVLGTATMALGQTVNMGRTYVASQNVRYANEAGTGTTLNKLAKLTGAPSTAIITAITDTAGIVGIVVAGAGAAGSADIAFSGKASCVFDSATTAGHYVVNDTSTAGDCMDIGATYPTSGQVIGVVTSTNGGAGTYEVDLTLGQNQAGPVATAYINYKAAVCQNVTATAGFSTPAANPATAACVTGANTNYGVLQFTNTAEESVQDRFVLPSTWTGTIDLLIKWRCAVNIAGDVVWQVQTACVADNEAGDPAFNAASTVTNSDHIPNKWSDATITTVDVTGCAAGEELLFRFFRNPAHASDTLADTAELISLLWTIRRTL